MKIKRFARDAGILVAFCLSFYLLSNFVGGFETDRDDNPSDFSQVRLDADAAYDEKDWAIAAQHFQELVDRDPHNGYAQNMLAHCWYERFRDLRDADDRQQDASTESQSDSPEVDTELRVQCGDRAREVFLRCKEFARYHALSLYRLATIDAVRGQEETAMEFLEEFVESGYITRQGLNVYFDFADRERFQAIVRQENANR